MKGGKSDMIYNAKPFRLGKRRWRRGVALAMALAFAGGAAALSGVSAALAADVEPAAQVRETSPAVYVSQRNERSVVGVLTRAQSWNRASGEAEYVTVGEGSGVVLRQGGYILTNNHVVEGGEAWQVLMPDGGKADAELVGADASTDLAVLKVTDGADALTPAEIGSSEQLPVGSTVVAIGNPGGEILAHSVTAGIISALERTGVNSSNTTRRIRYIQHDAAISSGNSGGGLFNYRGELIGINTLKYAGSVYSSVSFEGLGFAIPVETAVEIADQLIENGRVIRPGLGVSVSNYTNGPDEPLKNIPPVSVVIMDLEENGSAQAAGLRQYDFIYEVDGQRVRTMLDLTDALDRHAIGDTIPVTVVRYREAGIVRNSGMGGSWFGFGFDFGYSGSDGGTLTASGGYELVTADVTLQELKG